MRIFGGLRIWAAVAAACFAVSGNDLPAAELKTTVVAGHSEPNVKPGALNVPFAVGTDGKGTVFVLEFDGGRIFRLDGTELVHFAGTGKDGYAGDGGPALDATFKGMHGLAVDRAGNLFVADTHNHCVRRIDGATGKVSTLAGNGTAGYAGDGGPGAEARFNGVFAIDLAPTEAEDTLYVVDLFNRRVRSINTTTGKVALVAGNGKKGVPQDGAKAVDSPLADPRAVAADAAGNVYILERGGNALRVVRPDGTIRTVAGSGKGGKEDGPGPQASFRGPKHLCLDRDGSVLIADAENSLIRRVDVATGTVSTLDFGPKLQLNRPHGVHVDRSGTLYVVDSYFHRVLKVAR